MTKPKIQNEQVNDDQINELIENQPVTTAETLTNPTLNGDQINQFKPYENYFKNIFYYGTIGSTDHSVEKDLEQIFTKVTGRSLQSWTCTTCRKGNWYKLAKLYFYSINHINSVKKEEVCSVQDITV